MEKKTKVYSKRTTRTCGKQPTVRGDARPVEKLWMEDGLSFLVHIVRVGGLLL